MPKGMPIISDQIKTELIARYLEGVSAYQLAKQYGFKCSKSITKILNDNSIDTRTRSQSAKLNAIKFSNEDTNTILAMNADPFLTTNDIARKLDVDPATIKKRLIALGNYNTTKYDQYLIDKFDNITTEVQAYWIGFLAADGSLSKNQLALQLAEADLDHLLKFKDFIGVDYTVSKSITNLNGKLHIGYRYVVSSLGFIQSLAKHQLVPNKSLTLRFPTTIPPHLIRHYIRGLIDGDGSFWIDQTNKLYFSLVSTSEVCKEVQRYLMQSCDVKETKLEEKTADIGKKYYYLKYCGSVQCSKIAHYLYDGATIFLERKKNLLSEFISTHQFRQFKGANKIALLV
jgi:hypothetical protein